MFTAFLIGLSIALFLALLFLALKFFGLKKELAKLQFEKSSQSVRYGKMTEQFIPFAESFPYNPEKFRFLGNPIDGLVFGEKEIVFLEFKTGSSSLNQKQRAIKQLVLDKKVKWEEFRVR